MIRRPKSSTLVKILPPILSFVIGAIVSTAVGELIIKPLFKSDFLNLLIFIIILICLVIIIIMIYILIDFVNELQNRVGLKVDYLDCSPGHKQANLYERVRAFIESSEESILALTYLPDYVYRDDTKVRDDLIKIRDDFYTSIINQVRKGVRYERILQIDCKPNQQDKKALEKLQNNQSYLKHFHEMVELMDDQRYKSKLRLYKANTSLLTTFVLIDSKYLIWEIDELLHPSGNLSMYGVFIIEDPRKEITKYFEDFFDEILKTKGRGLVDKNELPNLDIIKSRV